jgi:hypothetical protein
VINDLAYVCNMPNVSDMFDKQELMYCTSYTNVLTDHQSVELYQVKDYQALINLHCGMIDVESSEWLLKVLEKSTEQSLLTSIKQTMSAWDPHERGGVSMFKAVVDKISANSFEFLQAGVNYIVGFRLSKFDGENVLVANTVRWPTNCTMNHVSPGHITHGTNCILSYCILMFCANSTERKLLFPIATVFSKFLGVEDTIVCMDGFDPVSNICCLPLQQQFASNRVTCCQRLLRTMVDPTRGIIHKYTAAFVTMSGGCVSR